MKFLPLKKKKDFMRVLKQGRRYVGKSLMVIALPASTPCYAVCVGKKFGKSVVRNRIKRLLRESFRSKNGAIGQPVHLLLIPKIADNYSYDVFGRDLDGIFRHTGFKAPVEGKPALSERRV